MRKISALSILLLLGTFGCQGSFTPMAPNFNPTVTFTPTSTFTPVFSGPSLTTSGTPTPTTRTPTVTVTLTGSNTPTATATSTFTLTGGTSTFTWTSTPTGSGTSTPTPTPYSSCVTLGTHDATPMSTVQMPADSYVANAYPLGGFCGTPFNEFEIYLSNPSPTMANMEFGVYDNSTRVAGGSVPVPGSYSGWLSVPIGPVTFGCGHSAVLVAHALSFGPSVGSGSSGCSLDSGNYIGFLPGTYMNPGILTSPSTGSCLEMSLSNCSSTVTPTDTPTPTVTSTLTGSPTPTATPTGTLVCPPTTIGLSAGVSIPNYGQSFLYVIRTQADWDAYTGTTGNTPPVDLSTQMLIVTNWGTEYCQPGNGMVYRAVITSACVGASSVDVRIDHTGTCTCGGSCYYTMASTQVSAVVLPASSLPVSVVP